MAKNDLETLIRSIVTKELVKHSDNLVPVALANRHMHICREHLDALFGEGYELTPYQSLSQPGQYACKETVDIVGSKGTLYGVRILGPVRKNSQIEVSIGDTYVLGVTPLVRMSGDLVNCPSVYVIGPRGATRVECAVIVAARHIHATPEDARDLQLTDGQVVSMRFHGERGIIFDEVTVRINPNSTLEFHLDFEEGNAAGLHNGDLGEIIKDYQQTFCRIV
ncbi:MAG: phosphate propanoyltransferase [Promethearchaeota archaeon]